MLKPADIESAATMLEGIAVRTSMEESRWLSGLLGGSVWLKCENLQRTGSFKVRGAFVRMSRLTEGERACGVVAASAGNHAQGVALAASMLGISATIFMPEAAPIPKYKSTVSYGAEVKLLGESLTESLQAAEEFAEQTGAILIHPFDHDDIIAGQGTVGLEIFEQVPDVASVIVPAGGGGLLAGIATYVKGVSPRTRVVGVQAEDAAAWPGSLAAGHPQQLDSMATMADGIAVARPGDACFEAVQKHVDEIVTVSEEQISQALVAVMERAKLVVEPAGVVAVAGLLADPSIAASPTVCVLSGGNVDPLLLGKMIRHGLASAGRYLQMRVCIPDRPGGLAQLLGELARAHANVVEIVHDRRATHLRIDEVEVAVQVETRGPNHAARVIDRLRERGWQVESA